MSQSSRVAMIYRHALKPSQSWMASRAHWLEETRRIRGLIEANKDVQDPSTVNRLITEGETEVKKYLHPDPYRTPFCYGSTLYGRNPPPTLGTIELDFGREKGTY